MVSNEEHGMERSWKNVAPLSLRVILGFGFAYHGFGKLFTQEGHAGFVGMLRGIGVPAPELAAWSIGGVEFLGGLLLFVGAAVTLVAVLQVAIMVGALFTTHLQAGFSFMNVIGMSESGPQFGMPGFEVNLLYIAGLVALIVGGAGALSVDRARAVKRVQVQA
jgi:putative oxidoreductase